MAEAKMAVNGPVFFLIQEQAKSVVAIQALQTRMAVLESLQERLMQAIDDVHSHLASSKETHRNSSKPPLIGASNSEEKLRFAETVVHRSELSKSDSLNKDSGIGGSVSSLAPNNIPDDEDELLQLLELIDQKSLELLKQVEGVQDTDESTRRMEETKLLDNLLHEKVSAQRQLSEVKAERDELRRRLARLELANEAVNKQKLKVQEQLDATLMENKSLQVKIHNTGSRQLDKEQWDSMMVNKSLQVNTPKTNNEFSRKTESLSYLADVERAFVKRKYLEYSEKSRLRVSSILKEGNVLELQKQLLSYVMENDILKAKLHQDEPSKIGKWLKIESQLRKDLKETAEENQRLKEVLQSKDLEIASLKDKIRALEEGDDDDDSCVRNFGMGSTEDWREPGVYNKHSNLNTASPFSPLGYGDFSKTQSLPAILLLSAQAKLKGHDGTRGCDYDHVYDTNSFTEIPLNHSHQSGEAVEDSSRQGYRFGQSVDNRNHQRAYSKDLVDLISPPEASFSSTSTLLHSNSSNLPTLHPGVSAPNLSSGASNHEVVRNWVCSTPRKPSPAAPTDMVSGTKLVNGHLCWKGTIKLSNANSSVSEDISSICTEFDPLSEDNPSCENFVDSLNLSIPLKPTQVALSQLSSIGDSLHSNSLDMGCTSMYQDTRKMQSARSVDGIGELVFENTYFKKLPPTQYGHAPLILGKHLPVNIIKCVHENLL